MTAVETILSALPDEPETPETTAERIVDFLKDEGFLLAKPLDPVIDTVLNDDPDSMGGCTDDYVAVAYFREADVR